MKRVVEPELLDTLPADDPRAQRSRRDLERINRVMGSATLLGSALDDVLRMDDPVRLVELGAGDGRLLMRIAERHAGHWPPIQLHLLDLKPVVGAATLAAYRSIGWQAETVRADVLEWLARPAQDDAKPTVIIANLFLHHFNGERLQSLLRGIAARAHAFVCLEPRRSALALFASRLVGLIGANGVTRHDAVASVRAGFHGRELSGLWPDADTWRLDERAVGMFSHLFTAVRNGEVRSGSSP